MVSRFDKRLARCIAFIAIVIALASHAVLAGQVEISVLPGELWQAVDRGRVVNQAPETERRFAVEGEIFPEPVDIQPDLAADLKTIRGLIERDYAANLSGDIETIAATFPADERLSLRELFADEEILRTNTRAARNLRRVRYLGWVELSGVTIALLTRDRADGRKFFSALPVIKVADGTYAKTNRLAGDETYSLVLAGIRNGRFAAAP